jgi:hypothetical protein
MKLLHQLLWGNKNKWQIYGAALGAFLGLFLVLTAFQFYYDLQTLMGGSAADQYVIINKKVSLYNTLGASPSFSDTEIDTIKQQSFVQEVGVFNSNQYKVAASSPSLGFYTELFFESVPDEFIDINTGRFGWEEGQAEIPIIMSRQYLALYNFGFAPSQGLPQFTPNTIGRLSVDLIIRGKTGRRTYQGRIVGFSDRINSIIVPESFLAWSNQRFGDKAKSDPSRVILKTDNPYAPELQNFLADRNYEVSSGNMIGGQLPTLLRGIISAIALIGLIIVLLSVLVLVLNFQLIISQSKEDIRLLLQLGYKNKQVSEVLTKRLLILFGLIVIAVIIALIISRVVFTGWFESKGLAIGTGLHWSIYILGLLLTSFLVFFNINSIQSSVRSLN